MHEAARQRFETPAFPTVSTGCLSIDWALDGGIPRGQVTEIFGSPGSGKTTIALHAVARIQRQGGTGVFLDSEHALAASYAMSLGVDTGKLIYSQPDCITSAFAMISAFVRSTAVDMIVLDSVAALGSRKPVPTSNASTHDASELDYWELVHGLRKLHSLLGRSACAVLLLNQTRTRLSGAVGEAEISPGGQALRCFAGLRVRMERRASLTRDGQVVGSRSWMRVVKNRSGASFREASFDILFESGISSEADLMALGLRAGILSRNSDGYWHGAQHLGQCADQVRLALHENSAEFSALDAELRSLANLPLECTSSTAAGS